MRNEFQNAVVPKYFDVKRMGGQVGLDHSVHDYKDGWNKLGHKFGASWDVLVGKDAGKFWGSNSKGQVWNNLYADRTARINSQQRSRELARDTIANGQLNHSSPVMAAAGFTGFDAGYNQAKIVGALGFQALEEVALTVATGGVLKIASLAIKGVMSAGRIGMGAIRSTRLGRRAAAYRRLKFGRAPNKGTAGTELSPFNKFGSPDIFVRNTKLPISLQPPGSKSCGPHAARSIALDRGIDFNLWRVIDNAGVTKHRGSTARDMVSALRKEGYSVRGHEAASTQKLLKKINDHQRSVVVSIKQRGGDGYHWVNADAIVKRFGRDVVAVRDPSLGAYYETVESFSSRYASGTKEFFIFQ